LQFNFFEGRERRIKNKKKIILFFHSLSDLLKYDRHTQTLCVFYGFIAGLNQPIGPSPSFFMRKQKMIFSFLYRFFARKQKCGKNFILSHFYHDEHFSSFSSNFLFLCDLLFPLFSF